MTWQLDATAVSALLDAREITPLRLLEQSLARLDALEPVLNAFTHVDRGAVAAATAATARQAAGARLGPLDGDPRVSERQHLRRRALPARWGSLLFREHLPGRDDICVERLRAAGAVIVGKTTTPELAMSGRTDSRHPRRRGDPSPGGVSRQPVMTAYRQQALACAALLSAGPGSPRDLRTVAPDAVRILLRNVYGWFERTERGVYQLPADGGAALRPWPDASVVHASNALALPGTLAFSQGEVAATYRNEFYPGRLLKRQSAWRDSLAVAIGSRDTRPVRITNPADLCTTLPVKRPKPSPRRFPGVRSRRPPPAVAGSGSSARSRTAPPEAVSCRSGPDPARHRRW